VPKVQAVCGAARAPICSIRLSERDSTISFAARTFGNKSDHRNNYRHPGESRDPFVSSLDTGMMDPGFRRDDDEKSSGAN
jgi:hypothetical protein